MIHPYIRFLNTISNPPAAELWEKYTKFLNLISPFEFLHMVNKIKFPSKYQHKYNSILKHMSTQKPVHNVHSRITQNCPICENNPNVHQQLNS
jgi:hypothetical protein